MLCPTLRQILFPFDLKLRILFQVVCGRSAAGSASPCQGEGRGFESRRPLENARHPEWVARRHGGVTERRGSGLQSRVHGFKSRLHLHFYLAYPRPAPEVLSNLPTSVLL